MKRRILVFVFFSFLYQIGFTQELVWSNEIKVKSGGHNSNTRPRLITLSENKGILIWGNEHDGSLSFCLWENDSLTTPKIIEIEGKQAFVTDWASTEIAGKKNAIYIVFKENAADTGKIYLLKSFDFGNSFSKPIPIVEPKGFYYRFPGVTVDENLNPIVSYMRFKTDWTQAEYVSIRSIDQGVTFGDYKKLEHPIIGEACDCCPVSIESDQDRVAIIFRNNRNNIRNMAIAVSNDLGENYSQFSELDTANWFLQSCPSTGGDAFFNDSLIHTCWITGRKASYKVYYSRFNINQNKVDKIFAMTNSLGRNLQQNFPRISGSKDTIVMIWQELTNTNDIFLTHTFTNADQLTTNIQRINIDIAGSQINPDVAFSNSNIYTCWQDDADQSVRFKRGKFKMINKTDQMNNIVSNWELNNGIFTAQFNKEIYQWTLLDVSGKTIDAGKCTFNFTYTLPSTSQIYLLQLVTKDGSVEIIPIGK